MNERQPNAEPLVTSTETETLDFGDGDEPVAPRKLSALVADKITDRILRNGLKPGSRLPSEAEMRQQLHACHAVHPDIENREPYGMVHQICEKRFRFGKALHSEPS